ncbi:MAG: hypothetical protein Q3999_00850 [Buchananella hordeovulneris]|nr:hypothetical protein [Buchananella hordeovulneris]
MVPQNQGFGPVPYGAQPSAPAARGGVVKAPTGILWAGIAMSFLGLTSSALLLLDMVYPDAWQLWAAVGTWLLCVVGGLGSAILYMRTNTKRQAEKNYDMSSDSRVLYSVTVALSVLSIAAAAAKFALLIGRM